MRTWVLVATTGLGYILWVWGQMSSSLRRGCLYVCVLPVIMWASAFIYCSKTQVLTDEGVSNAFFNTCCNVWMSLSLLRQNDGVSRKVKRTVIVNGHSMDHMVIIKSEFLSHLILVKYEHLKTEHFTYSKGRFVWNCILAIFPLFGIIYVPFTSGKGKHVFLLYENLERECKMLV